MRILRSAGLSASAPVALMAMNRAAEAMALSPEDLRMREDGDST